MSTQQHTPSIALITGGSRGLGKSMALHLADRDVIVTYKSGERAAQEVVAAIRARGERRPPSRA